MGFAVISHRVAAFSGGLTSDLCFCVASLLRPEQEVQQIFKAKHPMDTEVTKAKVRGT